VNVAAPGVPFGARGVVVARHADAVDVVFDEPFVSGSSLQGVCEPFRGKLCETAHLLPVRVHAVAPKPLGGGSFLEAAAAGVAPEPVPPAKKKAKATLAPPKDPLEYDFDDLDEDVPIPAEDDDVAPPGLSPPRSPEPPREEEEEDVEDDAEEPPPEQPVEEQQPEVNQEVVVNEEKPPVLAFEDDELEDPDAEPRSLSPPRQRSRLRSNRLALGPSRDSVGFDASWSEGRRESKPGTFAPAPVLAPLPVPEHWARIAAEDEAVREVERKDAEAKKEKDQASALEALQRQLGITSRQQQKTKKKASSEVAVPAVERSSSEAPVVVETTTAKAASEDDGADEVTPQVGEAHVGETPPPPQANGEEEEALPPPHLKEEEEVPPEEAPQQREPRQETEQPPKPRKVSVLERARLALQAKVDEESRAESADEEKTPVEELVPAMPVSTPPRTPPPQQESTSADESAPPTTPPPQAVSILRRPQTPPPTTPQTPPPTTPPTTKGTPPSRPSKPSTRERRNHRRERDEEAPIAILRRPEQPAFSTEDRWAAEADRRLEALERRTRASLAEKRVPVYASQAPPRSDVVGFTYGFQPPPPPPTDEQAPASAPPEAAKPAFKYVPQTTTTRPVARKSRPMGGAAGAPTLLLPTQLLGKRRT